MEQTQNDNIKITVSNREEKCNYCSNIILEGEAFIIIAEHIPFHKDCWELKKKKLRHQFGVI